MKLLKKGIYKVLALLLLLGVTVACEDDDQLNIIEGLDFNIATLNPEGNEVGVIATTVPPDGRILYTVDFGDPSGNPEDVIRQTSGPMVTYTYPEVEESVTYTITVTAALDGRDDVSISKDHTVIYKPVVVTPGTGTETSPIVGTWRLAPEPGSLVVGPDIINGGGPWFSINQEQLEMRPCLYDDEYVFNADGTFQNVLGSDTWLEPFQGMDPEGCGAPLSPHNAPAGATYVYDQVNESLTITGRGAHLGLAKVVNEGELASPADAPDSITYIARLNGDVLDIYILTDVANNAYWYFKLVRDGAPSIVGTWQLDPTPGSLVVGPDIINGGGPWFSINQEQLDMRPCLYDDQYIFNEDGTFQNVFGTETWLEPFQGMDPEGCGAPIFPHNGSNPATYTFDEAGESLTIDGQGAHLGLAKVANEGELSSPSAAPDSITYIAKLNGDMLEVYILTDVANNAYWYFRMIKQ